MINLKRFIYNPVGVNTYVVSDQTGEAVIIDCGCWTEQEWSVLHDYILSNNLRPVHLLNTHLHLDHVFGNQYALRDYGLSPEASEAEFPLYQNLRNQVSMFFGEKIASGLDYSFTNYLVPALHDRDRISFGESELDVIATPGHTAGGLCFYNSGEHVLFSGDTLFQMSIGRTDLPGGDYLSLMKSIQTKLMNLPPETTVYSGHGEPTQIGYEIRWNPYINTI